MSITLGDRVLDVGLTSLDTECDKIHVCSSTPTDYADTLTKSLGNKNFGAGSAFGAPAAGSPDGRKTTSVAITDGSVTASGTVACWAAVDSSNSRLLATGSLSGGMAVTSGWVFTLDAFAVHLPSTGALGYVGPKDIVGSALGWWGLRAYSAAYATGSNPAIDVVDTLTGLVTTTINIKTDGSLDVATIAGLGYGVSVKKLYDQSGAGLHLTQATLENMPLLTLSGVGSLPVLDFATATNGLLSLGNATGFGAIAQPFTISQVFIRITFESYENYFGNVDASHVLVGNNAANGVLMYVGSGVSAVASATDGTFYAGQFTFNNASSHAYLNGVDNTVDVGSTSGWPTGAIKLGYDGTRSNATMKITEIGFWGSAFDATQQSNMNANQRAYWGV